MKKLKVISALFAAALVIVSAGAVFAQTYKVAVSQIVEHPALDATRQGLLDGLKAKGYEQGKNLEFTFQTAQGNPAIAVQIAKQFVGEKPDVLVGIATPTAQALAASTRTIPVIFTAVTDPLGAKLVKDLAHPGGAGFFRSVSPSWGLAWKTGLEIPSVCFPEGSGRQSAWSWPPCPTVTSFF